MCYGPTSPPAMDSATRKSLYRRCNPADSLAPGDDRTVDLDASTPGGSARGDRWLDRLTARFALADRPGFELVTALPGSGVTTLLMDLAARLGSPGPAGPNLLPVRVDTEGLLDLRGAVDVPDILLAVVSEAEGAVAGLSRVPVAPGEGFLARTLAGLTAVDPELRRPEHAVADPARLLREMQLRPRLRERVRAAALTRLSDLVASAHEELSLLEDRARAAGRAGLVVLVDSLERLHGPTAAWREVLSSAEALFTGGAPRLRLPVHGLYTAPPALLARGIDGLRVLPALQLADRAGRVWEPGMSAARALVRRRLPEAALAELLGPAWELRVDTLAEASGGVVRDLVASLRALLVADETPLSDSAFRRLIEEPLDEVRRRAPAGAAEWLARVQFDRYLAVASEGEQVHAERALDNGLVVPQCDGQDWYALHPAVRSLAPVRAEYAHLERTRVDAWD